MEEVSFHAQAVLWGQTYEVLVKRGVLACLIEQGLISKDRHLITDTGFLALRWCALREWN